MFSSFRKNKLDTRFENRTICRKRKNRMRRRRDRAPTHDLSQWFGKTLNFNGTTTPTTKRKRTDNTLGSRKLITSTLCGVVLGPQGGEVRGWGKGVVYRSRVPKATCRAGPWREEGQGGEQGEGHWSCPQTMEREGGREGGRCVRARDPWPREGASRSLSSFCPRVGG